jgi:hypothetical protein
MPSVRILSDGGAAIIVDDVAYEKKAGQPTFGIVDSTPDVSNIQAETFLWDDSRVYGGSNHRTWTAGEMAVAGWAKTGSVYHYASVYPTPMNGSWYTVYTTPAAGIIRVGLTGYFNNEPDVYIRFNGTDQTECGSYPWGHDIRVTDWDSTWGRAQIDDRSYAFSVGAGVLIECNAACYYGASGVKTLLRFLPNSY